MAIYHEDILDIDLATGTIARSYANHAIGEADDRANKFGVRIFKSGEPVNVEESECVGFFMGPDGTNLMLTGDTYTGTEGNVAYVILHQNCYAVEGQFALAIKLISGNITGTMRIVDGVVSNTGATGAVAPTTEVPSSAEIIAAYEQAVAVIGGAVRHDITQSLDGTSKGRARGNIGAASQDDLDSEETARTNADNIFNKRLLLEEESIQNTTQTITFDSDGNVAQIVYTNEGATIRTDTFTYATNTITEVRTLATGESLTIVTNLTTLTTTTTYAAA